MAKKVGNRKVTKRRKGFGRKRYSSKKKKTLHFLWLTIGTLLLIAIMWVGLRLYSPVSETEFAIYISKSDTSADVIKQMKQQRISPDKQLFFSTMALLMAYVPMEHTGAYLYIPKESTVKYFYRIIKGRQTPIRLTFNNVRTKQQLAEKMDQQLMLDAESLLSAMENDTLIQRLGFTKETIIGIFLSDTYQVYWNISSSDLLERMKTEWDNYWNEERKAKALAIGLSPMQVITLASIVEEETKQRDEMPMVARLYLNRLEKGMPLQADPTIKFAMNDFQAKRILSGHLNVVSPYNTYKNKGLPPGPIRLPLKSTIEAVLNPAAHGYLYMCAKEDFSGKHNFAKTFDEHISNANRYRRALDNRSIR